MDRAPELGPGGKGRRRIHDDVDEEIRSHFEGTVELLMERGMGEEEAWAEARRRFGDVEEHRRRLVRDDRRRWRRRRAMGWVDEMGRNVAFALRSLVRAPGFALAVVLTLTLGIGANVTMFGVVDRLLLSPPGRVTSPDAVRRLYVSRIGFNGRLLTSDFLTYPDFEDMAKVDGFQAVAAYTRPRPVTMGAGESAVRIRMATATASYFPLLGVKPVLGRFYTPPEDVVGAAEPVVVLSHAFWVRRFGRDPGVLGRTLRIGPGTFTVVGVAPEGFTGAELAPVDVWVPLRTEQALSTGGDAWAGSRWWWWLQVVARLAPGVQPGAAEAQATAAHRAARADEPSYDAEARIVSTSLIAASGPSAQASGAGSAISRTEGVDESAVSRWLAGVSLIVLLIACANVANLLLARAVRWRREMAVRMALGSGRARLLAQLLTESLLLSLLGAGAALLVAWWGRGVIQRVLLPNVAFGSGLGPRLLAFTVGAAVLTALLAGLVPALQASRPDLVETLKAGGHGSSAARSRTRVALLVAQAALSVVLLVGAGLFVRSLRAVDDVDLGFQPRGLVVANLEIDRAPEGSTPASGSGSTSESTSRSGSGSESTPGSADGSTGGPSGKLAASNVRTLNDRAVERLRALPAVRDAAYTIALPFQSSIGEDLGVDGLDSLPQLPSGGPYIYRVSSGFFHTMELAILRGRGLEPPDYDEGAARVAVINQTFAHTVWPDEDALGHCLRIQDPAKAPCTRVVGIVEDSHRQALVDEDPQMLYYVPDLQTSGSPTLLVRTTGSAEAAMPVIQKVLRGLDPAVRYADVKPFEALFARQVRGWRLGATMFSAFGILALLVAAVGLYGVLSFSVAQRRYELGIRSALGATGSRIVTLVARQALETVVIGLALGAAVAWIAAPRMGALLFRVSPRDPLVYGGVAVVLLAVAALAALVPARRATRVDPCEALREE